MALETYRKKRDFTKTAEPRGGRRSGGAKRKFVVHKHDARRLHYDLRLEVDGVLRSWAVTRGPSLVPGEKRLAVHVEDHPLDYGSFEGTIPQGQYGGGRVLLWDRGAWKPVNDATKGYKKGHFEFELDGEKLKGRWHLVRMASKPREKRENWLLIKGSDAFARTQNDPDILEERPESVKTGRKIAEIVDGGPGGKLMVGGKKPAKPEPEAKQTPEPSAIKGARKQIAPDFVKPQFARLRRKTPSGDAWLHEIKFDGYRLQMHIGGKSVRVLTRTGIDWSDRFGKRISDALKKLPAQNAIVDGELVVETSSGSSDFSALQADLREGRTDRFVYYAFDLPYLDGHDLRDVALIERKAQLQRLMKGCGPLLRFSEHFEEGGEMILRHACRLGLEGVVSKRKDARYVSGRNGQWIKSKCSDRQEFVVAGYVPSTTSKSKVGSLVLGYHRGGKLVYSGRVGTGFSSAVASDLFERLHKLERDDSPFCEKLDDAARRHVQFVEPQLVAEVEFRSWTADGILRHAAFRGLREDKSAADVVREGGGAARKADLPKHTVKLTHPDRVYWDDAGVTKQGLADYYSETWSRMAPFVIRRPLALLRCPSGMGRQCFFQKHAWKGQSGKILTFHDPQDKSDNPLVAIEDIDGLIGLVQGGALEVHPWQSSFDELERPDQIVMDLDPGDDVDWPAVISAAREVRQRLEDAGLAAFVKTSGGKGLHVVSPLMPSAGWGEVKGFAKGIADAMAADAPERFVATIAKARRRGRILVDYLRNGRGATAVAPYSTRARKGAPVAMPLNWDELAPDIGPAYFTVENSPGRLANLRSDPWEDFRKAEVALGANARNTKKPAGRKMSG